MDWHGDKLSRRRFPPASIAALLDGHVAWLLEVPAR